MPDTNINLAQSAIVAIGTVKKVAVPSEDTDGDGKDGFEWDEQITMTGSFDHKLIDGVIGAEYMAALKKVVENPLELML
jgi:pyruvate dehydrogenase E2 component (dihydrolipoamide acetyltransferase)